MGYISYTKELTIHIQNFSLEMLSTIQLSKEGLDIILGAQLFTRPHGDRHSHSRSCESPFSQLWNLINFYKVSHFFVRLVHGISLTEGRLSRMELAARTTGLEEQQRSGILTTQRPGHYTLKYTRQTKLDIVLRTVFCCSHCTTRAKHG